MSTNLQKFNQKFKIVKKPVAILCSYIATTSAVVYQKVLGLITSWSSWDALLCFLVIVTAFFVILSQYDEISDLLTKRQPRFAQKKKVAKYFSGVYGRVSIFSNTLDSQIWDEDVFRELKRLGPNVEIFVKSIEEVRRSNDLILENAQKICLREWEPLRRLLQLDNINSDFILVDRGNGVKEFSSFVMEDRGRTYQNFDYRGTEHPVIPIADDFYKVMQKISYFAEDLKRAIGYYFVTVYPMSSNTPQYSLVHVYSRGQYGINYRGVSLGIDRQKISHQWNSTAASFHQDSSSLLFFTSAEQITHYENNGELRINNMGFIRFSANAQEIRFKSSESGQFYDIGENGTPVKQAMMRLVRVHEQHLVLDKIDSFDNFFDDNRTDNKRALENFINQLIELYCGNHEN